MFVVPGDLWEFSCWEPDPECFMLLGTYVPFLLLGARVALQLPWLAQGISAMQGVP